jgi:hypothetical protein
MCLRIHSLRVCLCETIFNDDDDDDERGILSKSWAVTTDKLCRLLCMCGWKWWVRKYMSAPHQYNVFFHPYAQYTEWRMIVMKMCLRHKRSAAQGQGQCFLLLFAPFSSLFDAVSFFFLPLLHFEKRELFFLLLTVFVAYLTFKMRKLNALNGCRRRILIWWENFDNEICNKQIAYLIYCWDWKCDVVKFKKMGNVVVDSLYCSWWA